MARNNNVFDNLYSLALQCCRMTDEGGCQVECEQCQFNVYNYVNDSREASLLKASAKVDYENAKEIKFKADVARSSAYWAGPIAMGIICLLIMMMCKAC